MQRGGKKCKPPQRRVAMFGGSGGGRVGGLREGKPVHADGPRDYPIRCKPLTCFHPPASKKPHSGPSCSRRRAAQPADSRLWISSFRSEYLSSASQVEGRFFNTRHSHSQHFPKDKWPVQGVELPLFRYTLGTCDLFLLLERGYHSEGWDCVAFD